MLKRRGKKKGQSSLEYLILVAAVIALLIAFLGKQGIFQQNLNDTLEAGTNAMVNMAGRLSGSYPTSP